MFFCVGYAGNHCEINIDDCQTNPCHHGTCQDGVDEYICLCEDGYTGNKCQTEIDECLSSPCENGGTCVDEIGRFECQCLTGTSGPRLVIV